MGSEREPSLRTDEGAAAASGQVSRRHLFLLGAGTLTLFAASACKQGPSACTDVSGLAPGEAQTRVAMEYVDRSPQADKTCVKCAQWIDAPSADQCGGCKVLKGPIHPDGYCKLFAPK